ncbi:MAG: DAK2 domain-containing protein [Actinomycetota bacterium]
MSPRTLQTLDAASLVDVMERFAEALREHRDELNSLNVFPVPDGDTGTNMLLTQEAVVRALQPLRGAGLSEVGAAVTKASLMGARGNSGVILSQVLRGLSAVLCAHPAPDGRCLADALREASREARAAVARPQPGTVLTVMEAAAVAATGACEAGAGLAGIARAALEAAARAVEDTPRLLPELRRAGVVDAGGRGALLLFDALASVLTGEPRSVAVGPMGPVGDGHGSEMAGSLRFTHEVMYLLEASDAAVAGLRETLARIGDSLVVVGGGGLFNVHVHTNDTEAALAAGRAAGTPRDARVEDLREQVGERCQAGQARAVQVAEQRVGLVAVAEGAGLAELFASLGAVVVAGGPGHNPSVEEIVAAVDATGLPDVVVLPNHRNVVPAAERAAAASDGRAVRVIPTRSIPAGLAAAAAFNPLGEPDDVVRDMAGASRAAAAGELAVAEREAETPAGSVRPGQWLGIVDGEVAVAGEDPAAVAARLVGALRRPGHEILTLLVGAGATADEAAGVRASIQAVAGDLEVEVHAGGQDRHPYLVGLE